MEDKEKLVSFSEAMEYIANGGQAKRRFWHDPIKIIRYEFYSRIGFAEGMDYYIEVEDIQTKDWILK
jgi:hypothetical protein